jgi:hypothetical protein
VPIVLKSGSLNLLEPSGPVKVCNGVALPLLLLEIVYAVTCLVVDSDIYESLNEFSEYLVPICVKYIHKEGYPQNKNWMIRI